MENNNKLTLNSSLVVLGVVVAVSAATMVGTLYSRLRQAEAEESVTRDVSDIITRCHSTIAEMDRALGSLHAEVS